MRKVIALPKYMHYFPHENWGFYEKLRIITLEHILKFNNIWSAQILINVLFYLIKNVMEFINYSISVT
jgi:hypothetical protein